MAAGYKKIFWGLFFVTFSLNLGPLQVLPPFVGWLIVLSGLKEVIGALESFPRAKESFQRAKTFGGILVGFTLLGTLGSLAVGGELTDVPLFTFYPVIVIVLNILTFFYILQGTHEVFTSLELKALEKENEEKTQIYLFIVIASTLLLAVALFFHHDMGMIFGALLGIAAVIFLLVHIHRLKKFWEGNPLESRESQSLQP